MRLLVHRFEQTGQPGTIGDGRLGKQLDEREHINDRSEADFEFRLLAGEIPTIRDLPFLGCDVSMVNRGSLSRDAPTSEEHGSTASAFRALR